MVATLAGKAGKAGKMGVFAKMAIDCCLVVLIAVFFHPLNGSMRVFQIQPWINNGLSKLRCYSRNMQINISLYRY